MRFNGVGININVKIYANPMLLKGNKTLYYNIEKLSRTQRNKWSN